MKQISMFAVVAVMVGLGIAAAVMKPSFTRVQAAEPAEVRQAASTAASAPLGACFVTPAQAVRHEMLTDNYLAARVHLADRQFEAALPQLREIAAADPGYPGVNLEIANALMQLGEPTAAKAAADRQVAASECLSKLPRRAVEQYCTTEFPQAYGGHCAVQMAYVWHSAQLQSELVKLELAHGADPHVADMAEAKTGVDAGGAPASTALPKHTRATTHVEAHPESGDRTLMDGAGTDSALGAYSRHQ